MWPSCRAPALLEATALAAAAARDSRTYGERCVRIGGGPNSLRTATLIFG